MDKFPVGAAAPRQKIKKPGLVLTATGTFEAGAIISLVLTVRQTGTLTITVIAATAPAFMLIFSRILGLPQPKPLEFMAATGAITAATMSAISIQTGNQAGF